VPIEAVRDCGGCKVNEDGFIKVMSGIAIIGSLIAVLFGIFCGGFNESCMLLP